MAYHLCSTPSSLHHSLCDSPFSTPRRLRNNKNLACPVRYHHRLLIISPQQQPKQPASLHLTRVSLPDQVSQDSQNRQSLGPLRPEEKGAKPSSKSSSSSSSYVWVNPNSTRASELRRRSFDNRYTFLVEVAESLNSCVPMYEDVSRIFSRLGSRIVEQDAVIVLNNMTNPETAPIALKLFQERLKLTKEVILYNVTLKVCRKSRNLGMAEKVFEVMLERSVRPDNVTFSTIITCARACSLPAKAVEWFEKMADFGCDPDEVTLSIMIDAYGRSGNVEKALSLYDRARSEKWRIDVVTFSTLIKIYGISGNYDGSLNVYEEMKALGVKPNMVIYNTLLDAMGRARRPWQAKSIYKEIIDNGLSPNAVTYAALLRCFGRARYGEDAINLYKEMKENGFKFSVVLYNTLLSMCADIGYIDEALEIYEDMKSDDECKLDSWTFSSLITIHSCCGKVLEAESMLNEMLEAGLEPNVFVLTSLLQCYGKANRTDDVARTFDKFFELGLKPDDRFYGCLLSVMTQTPKEELSKLTTRIAKSNSKISFLVMLLLEENAEGNFKVAAHNLFESISSDVKKAYCNCLIDLCVNLDLMDRACELLNLGLTLGIYKKLQSKTPTQWSLHLRGLSTGAALTALQVWMKDLSKALGNGEELPSMLGINTGHGKHKYTEKGLASAFESHLRELDAPFHEAPGKVGWFLTTKVAAISWLESRRSPELVTV